MKFFSVNKLIDELKLMLDIPIEMLTIIISGEDMYNDNFDRPQGAPCLIKVSSKKKGDKTYTYKDIREIFEDDFVLSITLPRKFSNEYLACMIDVSKPLTSDKFDGTYYGRKFAKIGDKTLKLAKEQQKYINEQAGISDEIIDL